MDFMVQKEDLKAGLRELFAGRGKEGGDVADLTASRESLKITAVGRNLEIPAEALEIGAASVPEKFLAQILKNLPTYKGPGLRFRITDGKFRMEGTSWSSPLVELRKVAGRLINIPADAHGKDVLGLVHGFSHQEIEESGLGARMLNAQHKFAADLDSAARTLSDYGVTREDLKTIADRRIAEYAPALERAALDRDEDFG